MTRSFRQFLTLASLTSVEALRQPICLLLTATCVILTALVPMLLMHTFGEEGKLVRDSGLALHFVFGVFIAGYAASSSLARERRSGTASAVLSKPVSRSVFFLAKFAGVAAVVALFSCCAVLATLLSERVAERFMMTGRLTGHVTDWQTGRLLIAAPFAAFLLAGLVNYVRRRPFGSTAFVFLLAALVAASIACACFDRTGRWAPFDFRMEWRIVPAGILVALALTVLSAIALSLSTRLDAVPIFSLCTGVFLVGLMSDYIFGRFAERSVLAWLLYRLVPNWQHFWVVDALSGGGSIPWWYVLHAGLYAAVYCAGVLCLGLISFRHTEMK